MGVGLSGTSSDDWDCVSEGPRNMGVNSGGGTTAGGGVMAEGCVWERGDVDRVIEIWTGDLLYVRCTFLGERVTVMS
jgi:hypothetical protein